MRWFTGTTTATGQIIGTRPDTQVVSIEFAPRKANSGLVAVGDSAVTIADGRTIPAGDTHSPDFEPGSIRLSEIYAAFDTGGDKLDWSVQTMET